MLGGGGDTTTSVLGGSGSDGHVVVSAAMVCRGGAVVAANVFGSNGNSNNSDERVRVDEGDHHNLGGNRWPRQETLALLKIRSDMDVTFRDASVKGPLWEEVSRKLAELGYHRSAKKCKEKFENVYKYHKRTKDGRTGKKSDGKTYRFSDHLQLLETHPSIESPPQIKSHQAQLAEANPSMPNVTDPSANPSMPNVTDPSANPSMPNVTDPSANPSMPNVTDPSATLPVPSLPQNIVPPTDINPTDPSFPNVSADLMLNSTSSSDTEAEGRRRKRKRKWKGIFEKIMKEVVQEQEEMHKKFLEALDKREHQRMVREEEWRMQEISRINRERDLLAQEISIVAAKDAALMALLQKLSDPKNPVQPQHNPPPPPLQSHVPVVAPPQPLLNLEVSNRDNGYTPSSSRWPKAEVQALIELRNRIDNKYSDCGPKGPLWEEISGAMKRLGYNRNAKRCKEKWENINKYFKKVKDNQKQRPVDAKACPYFHQLDALYREKNKHDSSSNSNQFKPDDNSIPLMVQPEQQWPPPSEAYPHQCDRIVDDLESDQNRDEDDDDQEGHEDEGGDNSEMVASRPVTTGT